MFNFSQAQKKADKVIQEGIVCIVGALIVNDAEQIFVQQRRAERRLYPLCWDIAGGHVEEGETLQTALTRELKEETGWDICSVLEFTGAYSWMHGGQKYAAFQFLLKVSGDMNNPELEIEKVSDFKWISKEEIALLLENRPQENMYLMQEMVMAGFKALAKSA